MSDERRARIMKSATPDGVGGQGIVFVNHIIQGLTSTLELEDVLTSMLEELCRLLCVTASSIWLYDQGTHEWVCLQATGTQQRAARGWHSPANAGLLRWIIDHGQSVIVPDAQQDTRHSVELDHSVGLAVRSFIGAPLPSRHGIAGVILAVDTEPDRFSPETLSLVELVGTAAAIAIDNSRLFQETRRRADRLAVVMQISAAINQPLELNAVVQTAARELTRALHIAQTGLALFDTAHEHLMVVADVPASGSPPVRGIEIPVADNASMQHILTTREPLAIDDAQHDPRLARVHHLMAQRQVKSILLVPLIMRGEVIGTIGCDAIAAPYRFTQEDIDLAVTVANLIAVRIEQTRLFEAERSQRQLAEALRDSAATLNQTLHFDEVLDRVLDNLGRVVVHDTATIMLVDDHGVARVARDRGLAERGLSDSAYAMRLRIDDAPLLREMIVTEQPLVIADVTTDSRWPHMPPTVWEGSYVGAPIRVKGRVIGFLQVVNTTPGSFSDLHGLQLQAFANQAAVAIENAQLYDQVQHYADELEQRVAERTHELSDANEQLKALDQVKDQFVSRVSHELRTPIANIQLYLNLLERGKPEKYASYVQTLHQEAARLNKMIEDLLDISHLDMGKTEFRFGPTDVNPLITTLVLDYKPQALERGLALQHDLQPNLLPVLVDPGLLARALASLLNNALNFTPRGGTITCVTKACSYADRYWVTIAVNDTGPGIASEELSHLGERFYRGQAARNYRVPGTGLGLAISKEIIDRHGGRLTIASEVGHGSSFTIWLRPA